MAHVIVLVFHNKKKHCKNYSYCGIIMLPGTLQFENVHEIGQKYFGSVTNSSRLCNTLYVFNTYEVMYELPIYLNALL